MSMLKSTSWIAPLKFFINFVPHTVRADHPSNFMNQPKQKIARRTFFRYGAVAAVGISEQNRAAAATGAGWIDAHVHVWTPDLERYPIDPEFSRKDMRPASFTPEELFRHTRAAGVDRIVLIQMSFYNLDNAYMTDMIKQYPGVFRGIGIVDHRASDLEQRMRNLVETGVRGFRLHARGDQAATWPRSAGMARLWKAATRLGVAVCPLINPADLTSIDQLCRQHPETTVVIDHFARVGISGKIDSQQLDALCRMAEHRNVHVKTSAFYALGKQSPPYHDLRPMIRRVVDAFGAERLMWASDCPYQVQGDHSYDASIALVRDAPDSLLNTREKEWMLRGTAEKLFF